MSPPRPTCTILGGANGSGKSTIYRKLHLDGEFVNADLVARQISPEHPEAATEAAGRRVLKRLRQLLLARESFVYETTLSSYQSIRLMEHARAGGYSVNLAFVLLRDLELNVLRVAERVMQGGHSIPENTIRRRYSAAFERLPRAIALAHQAIVYDNSNQTDLQTLLTIKDGSIVFNSLDAARPLHTRIATSVGRGLNVSTVQILNAARPG
ncbi:MAG TPA: zeta toxin family protein [Rhodopseudomonas sp.]|uniref:zeta toxin family protein n=1 Tax=Rhodopseudomonas sp. TaxID=1078 RepID=UPI002ED88E85